MEQSLFLEGLNLLMLGMGFVFIFLIFLVFATTVMSNLLIKLAPEPARKSKKRASQAPVERANDNELVAVMAAAIHHKSLQKKH
ncbi:OadG family protein [Photobacterium carnosum]|uniref:OadG family protein n=1 Tax=Photobacterium carnosum TaxID=2023717 RepID=UPI001E4A5D27|nr:OadG family protein [Photobacterium carnosum]MCD9496588.1 oxaloacetate decarboxylase [Photobacterium carnosum]